MAPARRLTGLFFSRRRDASSFCKSGCFPREIPREIHQRVRLGNGDRTHGVWLGRCRPNTRISEVTHSCRSSFVPSEPSILSPVLLLIVRPYNRFCSLCTITRLLAACLATWNWAKAANLALWSSEIEEWRA